MKDFTNYKGKNIIVLGLAKSGTTIAKLLHRLGANVIVNDAKAEEQCTEKQLLEQLGIKVICGGHPDELFNSNIDLIVKNPGIPYSIPPVQKAIAFHIPIVTEVEIAYELSEAPIIGITGSNGKTTTTTLIGEILKEAKLQPVVAGNIGTVLSEQAFQVAENQVLVAELSSFQLKGTIQFTPHIAVLLNIYPAHLDYHQTIEDYVSSKGNIFKNQKNKDFSIINHDCDECMKLVSKLESKIYTFSTKHTVDRGTFYKNEKIYWKENDNIIEVTTKKDIFLKGEHNIENVLAAITATRLYGASFEDIKKVLSTFKGVEHRLEYVRKTMDGIIFYNDSKATNPTATIHALKSFEEPVILIAGGLDRGIDFLEMIEPFKKHVKSLITYGQSAEKLKKIGNLSGLQEIITVDTIDKAVTAAKTLSKPNDVVLLSPACASWDMFKSFEERGRIFKEAVHKL